MRKDVKELICALCDTRQPVAPHCASCGVSFGAYHCMDCRFFDDDLSRQQFHCNKCGICRVGGRENFFHCDECGCCYSNSLAVGTLSGRQSFSLDICLKQHTFKLQMLGPNHSNPVHLFQVIPNIKTAQQAPNATSGSQNACTQHESMCPCSLQSKSIA